MDNHKSFCFKIAQMLGILLCILVALLILNQVKAYSAPSQTMNVAAIGKITAIPDIANITLGIVSEGKSPADVKKMNTAIINSIIKFLKQENISTNDIRTSTFYISPRYKYVNGTNTMDGYQANVTVTVVVRKVNQSQSQLENIVDKVVSHGANQIQGIQFGFSDLEKIKNLAIIQAIKNASAKAKLLANNANLKLGKIINIIETNNDYSVPATVNFAAKTSSNKNMDIEPGSQEVTANVTLVFAVN